MVRFSAPPPSSAYRSFRSAVFAGIGAITAISGLVSGKDMVDGILTTANLVLDVAIYVAYISCAKQIAKQAPSSEE